MDSKDRVKGQSARGTADNNADGHVDVPVRVRYADTDRMGIVYYGTYPQYFEIGRSEFMREKGFTYREFEEMGYHLVVTGINVRYHSAATYDDLLNVRTSLADVKSRGVTFHYEVFKDGEIVVEGHTQHICVDRGRKPVRIPPEVMELFKNASSA
ncbi:MAG TPA: thioesterase family protein [Syntrophorhabdales bacterium]|nr:thioesterase family protein [Syntrophorhabdales bacterium]